ncbi:MAG: glycosyltransferase family A protein [Bacteroidota bacterium]
MDVGTVSIIIPVYNSASTLARAMESVKKQTYSNYELILVNNGSTDNPKPLFEQHKNDQMVWVDAPRKGVSHARNVGMNHSTGRFVCFLDADDELTVWSLEDRVNILSSEEKVVVDGRVAFPGTKRKLWIPKGNKELLRSLVHLEEDCFCGVTWMVKKSEIEGVQFNESLTHSEDLQFCLQLAMKGLQYRFTNNSTYIKHHTQGSAMSNLVGLSQGYERLFDELSQWDIPKEWKEAYRKKARSVMFRSYLNEGHYFEAFAERQSYLVK